MIKALGVQGNSFGGSKEEEQHKDSYMLAVKDDDEIYDNLFAFMA